MLPFWLLGISAKARTKAHVPTAAYQLLYCIILYLPRNQKRNPSMYPQKTPANIIMTRKTTTFTQQVVNGHVAEPVRFGILTKDGQDRNIDRSESPVRLRKLTGSGAGPIFDILNVNLYIELIFSSYSCVV